MRGYLRWWLGMVPAIALPFLYPPLIAGTIAYIVLGFPVAMWRSKVARTNQFMLHARKTGNVLEAPKDASSLVAEGLRDYEYRRRNQVAVTEPATVEKAEE
jgi:hypothetical protein